MMQYSKSPTDRLLHRCNMRIQKIERTLEDAAASMNTKRLSGKCVLKNSEALVQLHELQKLIEQLAAQSFRNERIASWYDEYIKDDDL